MLAVAVTMGFMSMIGERINSMTLVVPFLVMAIGVDDAFLMVHAWQRLTRQQLLTARPLANAAERLAYVLEDVGPSITITSLTNCLAFGNEHTCVYIT
jgi:predicted RND superfamily exporter protein